MSIQNQSGNTSLGRLRNPPPPPQVQIPHVNTLGIRWEDQNFLTRFIRNSERRIRPTKFYNHDVAESLGVEADVRQLFDMSGKGSWLELHAQTYKRLTLEFLSSFYIHRDTNKCPRYITFQLMNADHRMTIEELNQTFGWSTTGNKGPMDAYSRK